MEGPFSRTGPRNKTWRWIIFIYKYICINTIDDYWYALCYRLNQWGCPTAWPPVSVSQRYWPSLGLVGPPGQPTVSAYVPRTWLPACSPLASSDQGLDGCDFHFLEGWGNPASLKATRLLNVLQGLFLYSLSSKHPRRGGTPPAPGIFCISSIRSTQFCRSHS